MSKDEDALGRMLFLRLSPMLALRILSLQAFDQLDFLDLYGNLRGNNNEERGPCIATLLLERYLPSFSLIVSKPRWLTSAGGLLIDLGDF